MTLQPELVHKTHSRNSWLQFYGEYVCADLKVAILAAGWSEPEHKAPPVPEEFLDRGTKTDVFVQPKGSDLFGGSTDKEWKQNFARLQAAVARFGITLGRSRKAGFSELI